MYRTVCSRTNRSTTCQDIFSLRVLKVLECFERKLIFSKKKKKESRENEQEMINITVHYKYWYMFKHSKHSFDQITCF